jgi:predicted DsbA family dithiol-disulfide isomerase
MPQIKITHYLDVMSSWCHWAEPAWEELQRRYAGRVEFAWKIALMGPADFPASPEQCAWAYCRSGGTVMHSPYALNTGWVEPARKGDYTAPNLVAEAGRDFGIGDDSLWRALLHAAVREGRPTGRMDVAVQAGAQAARLDPAQLRAQAESAAVRARVEASTAEFHAHRITQRPAFIIEDAIADKAVVSGLVRVEPLAALIDAMLADTAAYAAHAAHHPPPSAAP